jgi:hypothetical protein
MQTPFPEQTSTTTFFSRERRRQRMLQFLEAFERRSWPGESERPYLLPFSREQLGDAAIGHQERTVS